ncbi:histidine kinase [Bacillus sp. DTU_2020_1000418_1_SI_GHA_SEK_038]|uniref:sensor histidine kinase n=1 Tax=Bacillus sp. DTU_2020_1000418_1_SI_GHA_SEK_038 TaxID=3077585 RepID=UPI0028F0E0D8|nr:histidine kinase [Bacillus sp. DTU_2020_1000418_1_SI_GHA_SEK_038]WNS75742.1 histidine kinase [Bacillus sp. DTU_2020_1000418_1_SI_GHA_SEK_038]
MVKLMNTIKQEFQYVTILLLLLVLILSTLSILPAKANGSDGFSDYVEIPHSSIQYHLEPLSEQGHASQPTTIPTDSAWTPYAHQKNSGNALIWLRLSISDLQDELQIQHSLEKNSERLQLFFYPSPFYYEVYQNNQLIHQFGDLSDRDPRKGVPRWDSFNLNNSSDDVYIRLQGKIPYHHTLGSEAQVIDYLLKMDAINIVSIIGFFVTGVFALFLYLYNRKQRLLLFYALFIIVHFSIWPYVTYSLSRQLFFPIPAVTQFYLIAIGQFIAILLLLLLFREIIYHVYRKSVLWSTYLFTAVGITGIAATAIHAKIVALLFPVLSILIALNVLLILVVSILSIKKQKNPELILFSSGLILFIFLEIALNLALAANLMDIMNMVKIVRPFAIVLPGTLIIIRRYRQADTHAKEYAASLQLLSKQLEEDNRLLEQRVLERTRELEKTHKQLVESIQEGTAAAVEIAALEERNLIAQEIHDIVGHTLTTTIVQIEAGKRLIAKQPEQAIERMEISQQLIRKGLDEIRTSVRLLKDADWNYDLPAALLHIIEETIKYAGVQIESSISKLPPLSIIQKNMIFMALKEGLTNGIKHGGCQAFFFTLKQEDDLILFQLKNNGEPTHKKDFGFGLTTMQKRVESQQGILHIHSEEAWNYVLDIRFPVS